MNTKAIPNQQLKIVVIGGTGLIGSKLVASLRQNGHEVVAASPSSGVNTLTGEGLREAFADAAVVVDVSNSPSFEDQAVLDFFDRSTRNLLAAEVAAGVKHHVALSVVGTERLQSSGYFRAKLVQENLIKSGKVPYTLVRATQFFEFVKGIAQVATEGTLVRVPPVQMQPMVSDDVADLLAKFAVATPRNGMVEIAGPELIRQDELIRCYFQATGDSRSVVADPKALYFGSAPVDDRSLTPGANPHLGRVRFGDWLNGVLVHK